MDREGNLTRKSARPKSFNWATAFQLWIEIKQPLVTVIFSEFQLGHSFSAMDSFVAGGIAFATIISFNWATAFQLWIVFCGRSDRYHMVKFQLGHSFSAMDRQMN